MIQPSIAPWLTVADGAGALRFYTAAFGAVETYRVEAPDGALVLRLAIGAAEFWISGGPTDPATVPAPLGGDSIRMILTIPDPERLFSQALKAGAMEVFPVGTAHGWKLGRLVDPFWPPLGDRSSVISIENERIGARRAGRS